MNANPTQLTQVVTQMTKLSTISLLDDMLQTDHMFISNLYQST